MSVGVRLAGLFVFSAVLTVTASADPKSFYFHKMEQAKAAALAAKLRRQQLPAEGSDADLTKEGVFTQKTNHKEADDAATFAQRYYTNTAYASGPDAPVLFYLCGEATCEPTSLRGAIESHAKDLKAAMVALEHRYYGKSQPFDKLSAENMRYLTIEQALEDAAAFQKYAQENLGLKGKWIVLGGSYPGSLSAYYRQRFPDLVVGSLASSGPVQAEENFESYDHHVATVAGPECLANIKKTVEAVEASLTDKAKAQAMRQKFEAEKLVDDVDFLYLVADMGALAIQYGYRDRFCNLLQTAADPVEGYAQFTREIFVSWGMDALSGSAAGATSEDPNDYLAVFGMRQWFYQSCTEYGYWQNAFHDPKESARSARINLDYHRNICKRLFKLEKPVDAEATNKAFYEPLLDKATSNIFFTNGSRDPWSNLSISVEKGNNTNPNTMVMTLKDASHCDDLRAPRATDLPSVKEARKKFVGLAKDWLGIPSEQ